PSSGLSLGLVSVGARREAVCPAGAPQGVLPKLRRAVAVGLLTGRGAGSLAVPPPETIIRAAVAAACPADSPHRIGPEPVQAADGAWWCRFPVRLMERMVELKVRVLHEWGLFDVEQTDRTTYVLQRLEQVRGGVWGKLTGKKKS